MGDLASDAERDLAALHWSDYGAEIVIESTGRLRDRDSAALHLKGGAQTVLLSAPGKNSTQSKGVRWYRQSTKTACPEGAPLPRRCVLPSALTAITRTVTVAGGRFAPGHLGELTAVVPFELVDVVLAETRTVQRRDMRGGSRTPRGESVGVNEEWAGTRRFGG